jgi:hypothetical protein
MVVSFATSAPNTNIRFQNCRFLGASQNDLLFFGNHQTIVINQCYFTNSNFNTSPTSSNRNACVVFDESGNTTTHQDIWIANSIFEKDGLASISLDQSGNFTSFLINNVHILNNTFRLSTGAIICRGKSVWIENNVFDRCGLANITQYYTFITAGGLNRYQSITRANAGQTANAGNTMTPAKLAVHFAGNSLHQYHRRNIFLQCGAFQKAPAGDTDPTVVICDGNTSNFLHFDENVVDETGATVAPPASPLIRFGNSPGQAINGSINRNYLIFDPGFNAQAGMILVNDPSIETLDNHVLNGGTTFGVIDQSGSVNEPTVTVTDGATPNFDATLGTQFMWTLGANRATGVVVRRHPGKRITHVIKQDGTGGRTLSWDSTFTNEWSNAGNAPNAVATITHEFDEAASVWRQVAYTPYRIGTGAMQGRATLVGGTVTVSTTEVHTGDNILLTNVTVGGTVGVLSVGTITDLTSFVINSSSGTDTSTVYWRISRSAN